MTSYKCTTISDIKQKYSYQSSTSGTTAGTVKMLLTSGITITAPNSVTTYSGIIIVEGY